ncbi:GerAB/ArcD/ProY family transporter [Moorella sp. Hama-1]|uniref:GerAB/ArcD/ProY family transporter n=1 Tax=Moorella sp. Hama-1 TaxID=2138101 RepID=UPI0021068212|nr:endospore germination permease [Moorella sp. Hama-1]
MSGWQLAMLLTGFLIGTTTLIIPVGPAKESAWLSVLLAGVLGIGVAWLYTALGVRFPGETPFQYTPRVLGRWLGTLVVLFYLWLSFHLAALILRNLGELYVVAIMVQTPMGVFIGILAALAAWIIRSGLEPVARLAELLSPWLYLIMILLDILTFATPNLTHLENLLPLLPDGKFLPVIQGILPILAFPFAETFLFLVVIPFLVKPKKSFLPFALAMAFAALITSLVAFRNVAVLGASEAERVNFPSLVAVQLINLGDFLQRLDALIIFMWTFAGFIKLCLPFYFLALGLATLLKLKDYRPLVLPLGLLIAPFALHLFVSFPQMIQFTRIWPFYSLPITILLPALTLMVAAVRGLRGQPAPLQRQAMKKTTGKAPQDALTPGAVPGKRKTSSLRNRG